MPGITGGSAFQPWEAILIEQQKRAGQILLSVSPADAGPAVVPLLSTSRTLLRLETLAVLFRAAALRDLCVIVTQQELDDDDVALAPGEPTKRQRLLCAPAWGDVVFFATAYLDAVTLQIELIAAHLAVDIVGPARVAQAGGKKAASGGGGVNQVLSAMGIAEQGLKEREKTRVARLTSVFSRLLGGKGRAVSALTRATNWWFGRFIHEDTIPALATQAAVHAALVLGRGLAAALADDHLGRGAFFAPSVAHSLLALEQALAHLRDAVTRAKQAALGVSLATPPPALVPRMRTTGARLQEAAVGCGEGMSWMERLELLGDAVDEALTLLVGNYKDVLERNGAGPLSLALRQRLRQTRGA